MVNLFAFLQLAEVMISESIELSDRRHSNSSMYRWTSCCTSTRDRADLLEDQTVSSFYSHYHWLKVYSHKIFSIYDMHKLVYM